MSSKAFKTIFIRRRGRVIPIRVSNKGAPDELQKVVHKARANKSLRQTPTPDSAAGRKMQGVFFKIAKRQSKETGEKIARRLNKIKKKAN